MSNGSLTHEPDIIDDKKLQKVCWTTSTELCKRCILMIILLTLAVTAQPQESILSVLDEYEFLIAPLIFTFFAFFTRMYKIGLSPIVTWDEAQ